MRKTDNHQIFMFWKNVITAALENEKHRQWLTIIMAKNLLKSIFMVEKCKIRGYIENNSKK